MFDERRTLNNSFTETNPMREFLLANPSGVAWSFCIRISGIGTAYSDGLGDWSDWDSLSAYTVKHGGLVTREFSLGFLADPQKPLKTGDELKITLMDDGSEQLFQTFAPRYFGKRARLARSLSGVSTSLYLDSIADIEVNDYLHLGSLETVKVTALPTDDDPANPFTITRAHFQTVGREFQTLGGDYSSWDNGDTQSSGQWVTTSPTTFRNRIVEVFMAPVHVGSYQLDLDHVFPIWAGVLVQPKIIEELVELQCAPLSALVEGNWPGRLASGKLSNAGLIILSEEYIRRGLHIRYIAGTSGFLNAYLPLGRYVETVNDGLEAQWVELDPVADAGQFPMPYIIKILDDTVARLLSTATNAPWKNGVNYPFKGCFRLSARIESNGGYSIRYTARPASTATVSGDMAFPIRWMQSPFGPLYIEEGNDRIATFDGHGGWDHWVFPPNSAPLSAEATVLSLRLDTQILPGEGAWTPNIAANGTTGLLRISGGGKTELVAFSTYAVDTTNMSTDPNDPRIVLLTNVRRGYGGTQAQEWGTGGEEVEFKELLFISENDLTVDFAIYAELLSPDVIVNGLLLSHESSNGDILYTDAHTGISISAANLNGYRAGIGIPPRFVDYEGICRTMRRYGADDPVTAFWVEESGKGKTALEELLKMYGLFLVTKQFVRNGQLYFGLSVDTILSPSLTTYDDYVQDDDRLAGTKVSCDVNERLVINTVSLLPWSTIARTDRSEADPIIVYDEISIAENGPAKTLELKPTVYDWYVDGSLDSITLAGREAHISVAISVADRWFSAYGKGPYMLRMTCIAPLGWRFQVGDHVKVQLLNVRDPEGNKGLTSSARIMDVKTVIGDRPRADIMMYVKNDSACELAPSAIVTACTSSTLTLDADYYAAGAAAMAHDAAYFDPAVYGGDIAAEVWYKGDYSSVEIFNITGRSGNVLTVDTDLTTFWAGRGSREVVLGFQDYGAALTAWQQSYAHMASESGYLDTTVAAQEYL